MCLIITDFDKLCKQAQQRKPSAFRPGTASNHVTMIKKYVSFCLQHRVRYVKPTPQTICAYIESLARQFSSHKSVMNYVSAIKLLHNYIGKKAQALDSFEVVLMVRSVRLTMRNVPYRRPPVTIQMLSNMCRTCDSYGRAGLVIKFALQLAFFAFLRASNLCAPTSKSFDNTRHFVRSDVSVNTKGLTLQLKWSKTLQIANQPLQIPVPRVQDRNIDVVRTFEQLKRQIPTERDAPLFSLPGGGHLTLLQLRKAYRTLLTKNGYSNTTYTLHSLRRGGATACYDHGAKELDIQRQGVWATSCYKNYISNTDPHQSSICRALISAAQAKNTK